MERQRASEIFDAVAALLRPYCDRLSVAGSLRRQKDEVKDIEILAIPRTETGCVGGSLFPVEHQPLLAFLDRECQRPDDLSSEQPGLFRGDRWGCKYRKILHRAVPFEEIAIDLFLVTPESWGNQLAIRTGPADFSRLLVTPIEHGGCLPTRHHMTAGRVIGPDREAIPLREEREFFDLLRVPYWTPRNHCEFVLRQHLDRTATIHHTEERG